MSASNVALPDDLPPEIDLIGEGQYYSRCRTCENWEDCPTILYRTDEKWRAKMEARDHKEWHPQHFPIARGPGGERIYG